MKLISWNVNGIRSTLKNGFADYVTQENPDILFLQETKSPPQNILLGELSHQYWNTAKKKGYSGVAVFSKEKPLSVKTGLEGHEGEGRVLTLEFPDFYAVNVYVPNSKIGLTRLDYRQQWDKDFLAYLKQLEEKKPVIVGGDFNVAHKEIDLKNPKSNRNKTAGFTDQEREGFTNFIECGFVDTFREFNLEPHQYSWWSYRFNARKRNIGWRIDYFLISNALRPQLKEAFIRSEVMGSDHCPVGIDLN